ncbi:hypothetical protein F7734_13645 [Scytonema sp. UIC 10036]|uniref:hypothetical protein n=1 Tax=Scytonema sp. UIC 10036 TaxID=2304196 RepID=UPI0012DA1576|nr:hypothetical protein [Scytonema sp. UIC 10036]MUG93416.1 hypothetical protein [Scytonema sp. UIC 10036]
MTGTHKQELKFIIKLDTERKKVLRVSLGWTMADVERAIAQSPSVTVEDVLKVFSQEEWNELSLRLASFAGPETKTRQRQQAYQKGLVTMRDKSIVTLNETLAALEEQIRKDRKQIEINQKELEQQQERINEQRKTLEDQKQEIIRQEKQIEIHQKTLNENLQAINKLKEGSEILIEENEQLRDIAEYQNQTLVKIRNFIISTIKYIPNEIKKILDIG